MCVDSFVAFKSRLELFDSREPYFVGVHFALIERVVISANLFTKFINGHIRIALLEFLVGFPDDRV